MNSNSKSEFIILSLLVADERSELEPDVPRHLWAWPDPVCFVAMRRRRRRYRRCQGGPYSERGCREGRCRKASAPLAS